jgi:hypothetical protein
MPPSVRAIRIPRCPRPERRVIETRLRSPVVLSLRARSRPFWPAPLAASVAKGWSRALTVHGCGVTIPVRHRPRARNRASESLRATRHQTSWPAGAPQGMATGRTPVGLPTCTSASYGAADRTATTGSCSAAICRPSRPPSAWTASSAAACASSSTPSTADQPRPFRERFCRQSEGARSGSLGGARRKTCGCGPIRTPR